MVYRGGMVAVLMMASMLHGALAARLDSRFLKDDRRFVKLPLSDALLKSWERPQQTCREAPDPARHFHTVTCKVLQGSTVNGTVFVTFLGEGRIAAAKAWAANIRSLGLRPLVAVTGKAGLKALELEGIPTVELSYRHRFEPKAMTNGSGDDLHILGAERVRLVHQLTNMDVDFVVVDVRTLFTSNPLQYFNHYPEADLLLSGGKTEADHLVGPAPFTFEGGGEEAPASSFMGKDPFAIPILFVRSGSVGILQLVKEWLQNEPEAVWDWRVLDRILRTQWQLNEGGRHMLKLSLYYYIDDSLSNGPNLRTHQVQWGLLPIPDPAPQKEDVLI